MTSAVTAMVRKRDRAKASRERRKERRAEAKSAAPQEEVRQPRCARATCFSDMERRARFSKRVPFRLSSSHILQEYSECNDDQCPERAGEYHQFRLAAAATQPLLNWVASGVMEATSCRPVVAQIAGAGRQALSGSTLFVSVGRTLSPLHKDPAGTLLICICGDRTVWTAHPDKFTPDSDAYTMGRVVYLSDKFNPGLGAQWTTSSTVFTFVMRAGDAVYLPTGWWHAVGSKGGVALAVEVRCHTGSSAMLWRGVSPSRSVAGWSSPAAVLMLLQRCKSELLVVKLRSQSY